jgi:uncharacterized protein (UPF0335 family)
MANMIVTIHQPEHFPYMGFFQKISSADLFVVLDNVKFRKNYFQNRNKIKLKSGDDAWITVPVEKTADSKDIKDVLANKDSLWRRKIVRTIQENLKFDATEIYQHEKLLDINMTSIRWSMEMMGIKTPTLMASSLDVEGSKSELLANILRKVGASKYISGPSGRDYLDLKLFEGIEVEFFEPKVNNYYSSLYNILQK